MNFSAELRSELDQLFRWRRDVRRFRRDPIARERVARLLETASTAPSVGLSEPWRFVMLEGASCRSAALANFKSANANALAGYEGQKKQRYSSLKLSGMEDAPVQIAAYCDEATQQGSGLGIATMPEMLRYSVVCAIHQIWLAARADGIGMGWVSILDPEQLARSLDIPTSWRLVGYLCLGLPEETHVDPEMERAGWESRRPFEQFILTR